MRVEQRLDHERFVCESEGRFVWDLTVRSDGRPSAGDPGAEDWFYTIEDGEVYRVPVGGSGISQGRLVTSARTANGRADSIVLDLPPLSAVFLGQVTRRSRSPRGGARR